MYDKMKIKLSEVDLCKDATYNSNYKLLIERNKGGIQKDS